MNNIININKLTNEILENCNMIQIIYNEDTDISSLYEMFDKDIPIGLFIGEITGYSNEDIIKMINESLSIDELLSLNNIKNEIILIDSDIDIENIYNVFINKYEKYEIDKLLYSNTIIYLHKIEKRKNTIEKIKNIRLESSHLFYKSDKIFKYIDDKNIQVIKK